MLKKEELEELRIKFGQTRVHGDPCCTPEDYNRLLIHGEEMHGMMERISKEFTELQEADSKRDALVGELVERVNVAPILVAVSYTSDVSTSRVAVTQLLSLRMQRTTTRY